MNRRTRITFDVVIAGAGPAGLSAALVLGRACRRVLVCDTGTPRSWSSKAMHSFISRDGIVPARFLDISRRELLAYPDVQFAPFAVSDATRSNDGFDVTVNSRRVHTRKLLLATGLFDVVPRIPGIDGMFGRSVFQCPYCDGWEMRGKRIAVYGRRQRGFEMARAMTAWANDITLCSDGLSRFTPADRRALARNGISHIETPIERLEGRRGALKAVVFRDGTKLPSDALFFDAPSRLQSALAAKLGCRFARNGGVASGKYEATSVPGVFVAGNITRDVQLSIVAAAEGARAAFGINRTLTREDFASRAHTSRTRI